MKEWFKYKYGFVNIDTENIYFNNSGNWADIKSLKEKNNKLNKENKSKRNWMWFFVIVSLSIFGLSIIRGIYNLRIGIGIFILAYAMYYTYEYFKRETGDAFKIPLNKLDDIKFEEKSIVFTFINGDGKLDEYIIENPEAKGIMIMESLRNELINQKK